MEQPADAMGLEGDGKMNDGAANNEKGPHDGIKINAASSTIIIAFGIFLSFIIPCFQVVSVQSATNVSGINETYALVSLCGPDGTKRSGLLQDVDLTILEDYGSFAYVRTTDSRVALLRGNNFIVQVLPNVGKIKFDTVTFDTSAGEPDIPLRFRAEEPSENNCGYYIVQMKGPPKKSWVDTVENFGGKIVDLVNYYAYIVKMNSDTKKILSQKEFIRCINPYHPFYKLRGGVEKSTGTVELTVAFFKDDSYFQSLRNLNDIGGKIISSSTSSRWENHARVKVDSGKIPLIAAMPSVWFIEPSNQPVLCTSQTGITPRSLPPGNELFNDQARWVIQSGINGSTPVWDQGLHGENVIVGIGDTGCDYDHVAFTDKANDQGTPGPGHRKIVRYFAYGDDWDNAFGHGTHTAGSIAGNNITNPGVYNLNDGMAYMARLSVADLQWRLLGIDLPNDSVEELFQDAANNGARSHSDSWGWDTSGNYDIHDQGADQYLWDHPDFLAVVSAGNNYGNKTTVSPGNAKNVVTVGACENAESEKIAQFSSRGPTVDGVRKPDLVAPGVNIWSAASDGLESTYNSGYKALSGTSMATPIVAGAGALIEQYFKEGFYPSGVKTPADGFMPSGPLRKAILINSGWDLSGADAHVPDNSQGWGRITLDYSLYFKGDLRNLWLHDEYRNGTGLVTGQNWTQNLTVGASQNFKVSLVWNDYPGKGLKNDLNLVVKAPNNDIYVGNNYQNGESVKGSAQPDNNNTVECVYVKSTQGGIYTIDVTAASVTTPDPQKFSIVVTCGAMNSSVYKIDLNAPISGEVITGGTIYNISWTTKGGSPPVTVEVFWSNDSGSNYTLLASSQPGTGEWKWNVPLLDINIARAKVIVTDKNGNKSQAESGDFIIMTAKVPEGSDEYLVASVSIMLAAAPVLRKSRKNRGD
jgi:subtilisin family serine protease